MNLTDKFLSEISKKNINIEKYANNIIKLENLRDLVIKNLISNENIMIYYNCYLIAAKASSERPDLFYCYWYDFLLLFKNRNSYHRNYGMEIIANLTKADSENRFDLVFKDYFAHLDHEKLLTIRHCIINSIKIMTNKKHLVHDIINLLLKSLDKKGLTPKQRNLLKSDVLDILDKIEIEISEEKKIKKILGVDDPPESPKIKKMIQRLRKKYDL